jgi:hypothetical protein
MPHEVDTDLKDPGLNGLEKTVEKAGVTQRVSSMNRILMEVSIGTVMIPSSYPL